MRKATRIVSVLVTMCLVTSLLLAGSTPASASPGLITKTEHVRLGCKMSIDFPEQNFHEVLKDPIFGTTLAELTLKVAGTIHLEIDYGADITFSYDPADLVPGGILPVSITYMPTNDSGPEISFSAVADVDIRASALYVFSLHYNWPNTTFVQATGEFIAPLGWEIPLALVPLSGNKLWIKDPVFGANIVSLQLGGLLQLLSVPSGSETGLGGAAAGIFVTGGLPTGDLLTRPILEW